jgi:hypothetical protein
MSNLQLDIVNYVSGQIPRYLISAFPEMYEVQHFESISDAYSAGSEAEVQDLRFDLDTNLNQFSIKHFVFLLPFEKSAPQAIQDAISKGLTFEQAMENPTFKSSVHGYLKQIAKQIGEKVGIRSELEPKPEPKTNLLPYIIKGALGVGLIWYLTKD